jgi:hypothetical protein
MTRRVCGIGGGQTEGIEMGRLIEVDQGNDGTRNGLTQLAKIQGPPRRQTSQT